MARNERMERKGENVIVRSPSRNRWVTVDNRAIEDPRLSCRAKGLLAYLLSRPDNWRASPSHLATTCRDSVGVVRAILQELRAAGYATLRHVRSDDGKQAAGTEWVIAEMPETRVSDFQSLCPPATNNDLKENKYLFVPEKIQDFVLLQPIWRGRVGAIYNRKATTRWSDKENAAFDNLCPFDDDELAMVERYYARMKAGPDKGDYRRRDLITFLNNYPGEADKARTWCHRNPLRGVRAVAARPHQPEAPPTDPEVVARFVQKFKDKHGRLPHGFVEGEVAKE